MESGKLACDSSGTRLIFHRFRKVWWLHLGFFADNSDLGSGGATNRPKAGCSSSLALAETFPHAQLADVGLL
jgi:hypothetical protein